MGNANKAKARLKQKESNLVKACIQYLQWRGFLVLRNNSGLLLIKGENGKTRAVKLGKKGSSDIIACSPWGQFVAIECKSGLGRLTDEQAKFLEEVRNRGGIAAVVRDVEELVNLIKKFDNLSDFIVRNF